MAKKIDYKYNLKEYFSFVKKYKWLLVSILVLSFILEVLKASDRFLFKIIVDKGTEFVAGNLQKSPFTITLIIVGAVFVSVILIRSIISWNFLGLLNKLTANVTLDLKRKYFNHIVNLSHSFHTSHKTGSLISRLTRSGGAIERMNDVIVFNLTPLIFNLIIVGGSLAYFSWKPALVIVLTSVTFVSYSLILQNIQKKHAIRANKTEDIEKGNLADILTNIDSVKYFSKEKEVGKKFKKLAEKTRRAFLKYWDYFKALDAGQSIILGLGTFFIIYFPLLDLLNKKISIGTLVFIYTIYGNIFWPLYSFVHGIRAYYRSMADFDALFKYGKIENEIKNKPNAKKLKVRDGEIEFKNICFQYGKRKLFQNFNLKIPKGKKVALVGHSGCGKTTLIKLLYRFYDPQLGAVLIDGKNIKDFTKESLRSEMAIVPQEPILFDDTIYNNIKFSKPDATKEEVMRAIKFAQLDKIIENLPKKEKTIVGERGVKLSGGEKQRVSIARAILANKKILILDEATSSLDSETEAEIQKDLEKLMKNRTSIIVAHRLSTIMKADKIVVMRNGEIVQQGKHKELIKQPGEYRKLWNLQKGGYIK